MKYIFVVNGSPTKLAIRTSLEHQLDDLKSEVEEKNYQTSVYVTTGIGDATRFVRFYSDLHQQEHVCFVACGGSGTINEVASGIVGFDNKELAIFTGDHICDVIRYYPDRHFDNIRDIFNSSISKIDVLKVNDCYSINMCNFGLDAHIAKNVNMLIANNISDPYNKAIRRGIAIGRYNKIKVVADGKRIGGRFLTLCTLANGKYIGDGILGAPYAKNNDGLIDICYIKPMSLLRLLITMKFYRRGKHFDTKIISKKFIYQQAKKVQISCGHIVDVCLDGEIIPGTKFNIEVMPMALSLRLPPVKK